MQKYRDAHISDLIRSSKKIIDIRYTHNRSDILCLTSTDGVGELYLLDNNQQITKVSQNLNVRGTVGYGGGDFTLSSHYYIMCEKSGNLFAIESGPKNRSWQVTSDYQKIASPQISPDENWVMYIFDQDEISGIGAAPINGQGHQRKLVTGSDFYMQPAWHLNGRMISWVEWDHPYMPWDASRVKIGIVSDKQFRLTEETYIDGQPGSSASQPLFSPNGKWLSYLKRNDKWDDLILFDLNSEKKKVVIRGNGFHLRLPDWVQGNHSYQWSSDSNSIFFIKYHRGTSTIAKLNVENCDVEEVDVSPYTWVSQFTASSVSGEIACIASSQNRSDLVVRISKKGCNPFSFSVKKCPTRFSKGQEIVFQSTGNSRVYAWFYPPTIMPKNGGKLPCILNMHSGPTSVKHLGYSIESDIFTSSGFAVVYLNYQGSTTYGYDYQDALKRKWGEIEIEDAEYLINELIAREMVDSRKLAVMGSSAGGFSVLNLLIKRPGLFQAGICSYAVSDLVDDARHTHKFEKYYHRFLTGEFPAEYERFVSRSPITHLDKIRDPLALFHGTEDTVVSPSQSQDIFDSLSARRVPCILRMYESEGHGFRKQETIEDYYRTAINFLKTHLK